MRREESCRLFREGSGRDGVSWLEQIPPVAVEVFKNRDGAVGFLARRLEEFDVCGEHEAVVSPEIVGVKKEENTASGLVAQLLQLFGCIGLRKEKAGSARSRRSHDEPSFVGGEWRVLDHPEAQGFGEEGEGLVVVADEKGDVSERLRHERRLSH
jgi:hypothetical protein